MMALKVTPVEFCRYFLQHYTAHIIAKPELALFSYGCAYPHSKQISIQYAHTLIQICTNKITKPMYIATFLLVCAFPNSVFLFIARFNLFLPLT